MFGKKRKDADDQVRAAQEAAQAAMSGQVPPVSDAAWQQAADATAMQRGLGIDTAAFGGPSNAPVADDDPIWEPIGGITIEHYAWISKLATNQGVTDEAGTKAIAADNGIEPKGTSLTTNNITNNSGIRSDKTIGSKLGMNSFDG